MATTERRQSILNRSLGTFGGLVLFFIVLPMTCLAVTCGGCSVCAFMGSTQRVDTPRAAPPSPAPTSASARRDPFDFPPCTTPSDWHAAEWKAALQFILTKHRTPKGWRHEHTAGGKWTVAKDSYELSIGTDSPISGVTIWIVPGAWSVTFETSENCRVLAPLDDLGPPGTVVQVGSRRHWTLYDIVSGPFAGDKAAALPSSDLSIETPEFALYGNEISFVAHFRD